MMKTSQHQSLPPTCCVNHFQVSSRDSKNNFLTSVSFPWIFMIGEIVKSYRAPCSISSRNAHITHPCAPPKEPAGTGWDTHVISLHYLCPINVLGPCSYRVNTQLVFPHHFTLQTNTKKEGAKKKIWLHTAVWDQLKLYIEGILENGGKYNTVTNLLLLKDNATTCA